MSIAAVERLAIAAEIEDGLRQLTEPGQVVELRALDVAVPAKPFAKAQRGYFTDPAELARCAAEIDGFSRGIYFTLNPVKPELLERCKDRLATGKATKDADILRRRWLYVDVDPVCPKNTNATDDELNAAIAVADSIWRAMRSEGWPEPRAALSGNGVHLLYSIDLPAEDGGVVARALHELARQFSTPAVKIDTTTSNAARICRLYGTTNAKAPDSPERPRRRAMLLGRERWLPE